MAKDVEKRGIADLGKGLWENHRNTVEGFWTSISNYFDSIDVSGMKIYQDGMVADGVIGKEIVEEGTKSGSKNYDLVSRLLRRGAILIKTEDFHLVKEERDRILKITQARTIAEKLFGFIKYKLTKNRLLNKRDGFIANRINETLSEGEGQTGILFLGAFHDIKKRLSGDIQIIEIKDREKVREYQRLLPYYSRNKKRFDELGQYLISQVEI